MEAEDFDFAVPQPKKKMRPNPPEDKVELDEEASRVIESQTQFKAQYIYALHDKLEQAMGSNSDQRMKYQDDPARFFDSQSLLNDTVQKLGAISAYPDLVADFINSRVMKLLVRLLDHPNESIVGEVVEVICEFVTMEIEDDDIYEKHLRYCVDIAQEKGFFKQLLKNVGKLDENKVDEYQIVYKILRIVVQLLDFSNALGDLLVDETDIMRYLADRVMPNYRVDWRPIDDNKYISSEILVELLQNSKNNRFTFGKFSGIQVLLESVAIYRKQIPDNEDQKQFASNLLNLLYIMLTEEEAKRQFNQVQGADLMLAFVANKNKYSKQAFKVLSFGFIPETCASFIQQGGLKYIFAILMRQGLKQKNQQEQRTIDQNCLAIIKILLIYTEGILHDRVLNKFRQKNFEKLLRLVEMRVEYSDIVREDQQIKDLDYPEKLLKGLRVIEQIDEAILIVCNLDRQVTESLTQLKANLKEMLKSFNISPQRINVIVTRYCRQQLLEGQNARVQLQNILQNIFLPYFRAQ